MHTMLSIRHTLSRLLLPVLLWGAGGCFVSVRAQQEAQFLQYWKTEPVWCPAAVGRTPQLAINAAIQTHAMGFENAGQTIFGGVDTAFQLGKSRHGVGALFYNDTFGLFSQMSIGVQYAYHQRMWGGTFSVGVEGDLLNDAIKGSKAELGDGSDPAFPTTDLTGHGFDVGVGLYYQRRAFGMGLSAKNLLAQTVTMGETNSHSETSISETRTSRDSAKIKTGDSRRQLSAEERTPAYIHRQIFGKKFEEVYGA